MKHDFTTGALLSLFFTTGTVFADKRLELETTIIKGNKELPQILYVVPWKDMREDIKKEHTLVLHSLFGNFFDPVSPDDFTPSK